MRLVKPSIEFLWCTPNALQVIELAGRVCYKSEAKITDTSAEAFVRRIMESKPPHEAVIEHASMSYRVICDRGVTHEIVRHRLFSYCQESTRFCNYKGGVSFIIPSWLKLVFPDRLIGTDVIFTSNRLRESKQKFEDGIVYTWGTGIWLWSIQAAESMYVKLIKDKWTPEMARSVLPNSLKTEIVITGNLREWRHFFKLRTSPRAHPQMQEIANMILDDAQGCIPVVFDEYQK